MLTTSSDRFNTDKAVLLVLFACLGATACGSDGREARSPETAISAEGSTGTGANEKDAEAHFVRPKDCEPKVETARFPSETEGAVYRAVVHLIVGPDGKASELCILRAEGDPKYEAKAFGNVGSWSFALKHVGKPRERVVSYRLLPPEN